MMQFGSQFFHLCVIVYSCFVLFVSGASLPDNEVNCYFSDLRSLDLHGELPFEFANLTYLSTLNLNRNYLSGTIPRAWASLPLVNL
ncbi:hypothetical protein FRX31_005190 [Thalictrum thalictroides]|uniref:Uncharacterized protein n=1 Tax=Thalictrum thalictroides TaxID=46969 RepID=A0A7J6X746_THATH|nr:hypothetical protein FRX31_005190 [Thalictrum thalictroides]